MARRRRRTGPWWRRYRAYLRSPAWRDKRERVLRRAGHRCEDCGAGGRLQVHHLTYERVFRERLSDLRALCVACHRKRHRRRRG